jgi:hypothetical protein
MGPKRSASHPATTRRLIQGVLFRSCIQGFERSQVTTERFLNLRYHGTGEPAGALGARGSEAGGFLSHKATGLDCLRADEALPSLLLHDHPQTLQ